MEKLKHVILTFTSAYLPGYKAGGPLRTIANLVEYLSDEFEFWIVTRDRDLNDTSPYHGIKPNEWQVVGKAMVYYLLPESCTINNIAALISMTTHDVLYLNSYFDPFGTIRPLLARRLGRLPLKPVIVAPRGEFSVGALQLKYIKKNIYIKIAGLLRLYNDVIWQASSEYEAQDIIRTMLVDSANIHVAINLPTSQSTHSYDSHAVGSTSDHQNLRVLFLSRISQKKNLDYALRAIKHVNARILFDIYGPVEDAVYWQQCQNLIRQLPENIKVKYCGSVVAEHVRSVFSGYDLFFFPTRGENYGHVIAESLSIGTPVLVSDQTPWRNLSADQLGWDIPLNDEKKFAELIDKYALMTLRDRLTWRESIKTKIMERLSNPGIFEDNRKLFRQAIRKREHCDG